MTVDQAKRLQRILFNKGYIIDVDGIVGPKTIGILQSYIKDRLMDVDYVIPTKGFVWLRTDTILTDTYDDFVVRMQNGVIDKISPATTTPGNFWIKNFTNKDGVAVAKPQQILGSHKFVTAKSWTNLWLKAPYFQQVKPIEIYRDNDKDLNINTTKVYKGLFGINFHRGGLGTLIGRWSAGCQVVPDKEWYSMIDIFKNGEVTDFTLIQL